MPQAVAIVGGVGKTWEWTKVKDVIKETLLSEIYRACKEWRGWTGKGNFFDRMDFVRGMMIRTIEYGWPPGLGPNGKPYWMCSDEELSGEALGYDAPF
jgi:hypothetical protein